MTFAPIYKTPAMTCIVENELQENAACPAVWGRQGEAIRNPLTITWRAMFGRKPVRIEFQNKLGPCSAIAAPKPMQPVLTERRRSDRRKVA